MLIQQLYWGALQWPVPTRVVRLLPLQHLVMSGAERLCGGEE